MGLYCLKCGVWAYRNHKCNIMSLIPLTTECRGLADKMYQLGFDLLSAGCWTNPVAESFYDHYITFSIELKHSIPPILALPTGWAYYTEIVGTDLQISALGYSETYAYDGTKSPSDRCQEIAEHFLDYLSTLDKFSLMAVMTLYNTGGGS